MRNYLNPTNSTKCEVVELDVNSGLTWTRSTMSFKSRFQSKMSVVSKSGTAKRLDGGGDEESVGPRTLATSDSAFLHGSNAYPGGIDISAYNFSDVPASPARPMESTGQFVVHRASSVQSQHQPIAPSPRRTVSSMSSNVVQHAPAAPSFSFAAPSIVSAPTQPNVYQSHHQYPNQFSSVHPTHPVAPPPLQPQLNAFDRPAPVHVGSVSQASVRINTPTKRVASATIAPAAQAAQAAQPALQASPVESVGQSGGSTGGVVIHEGARAWLADLMGDDADDEPVSALPAFGRRSSSNNLQSAPLATASTTQTVPSYANRPRPSVSSLPAAQSSLSAATKFAQNSISSFQSAAPAPTVPAAPSAPSVPSVKPTAADLKRMLLEQSLGSITESNAAVSAASVKSVETETQPAVKPRPPPIAVRSHAPSGTQKSVPSWLSTMSALSSQSNSAASVQSTSYEQQPLPPQHSFQSVDAPPVPPPAPQYSQYSHVPQQSYGYEYAMSTQQYPAPGYAPHSYDPATYGFAAPYGQPPSAYGAPAPMYYVPQPAPMPYPSSMPTHPQQYQQYQAQSTSFKPPAQPMHQPFPTASSHPLIPQHHSQLPQPAPSLPVGYPSSEYSEPAPRLVQPPAASSSVLSKPKVKQPSPPPAARVTSTSTSSPRHQRNASAKQTAAPVSPRGGLRQQKISIQPIVVESHDEPEPAQASPTEDESDLNATAADSKTDTLAYSKRPRPVEFKPKTLKEWKEQPRIVQELGKLGVDLDRPELIEKRAQRDRMREFAKATRLAHESHVPNAPVVKHAALAKAAAEAEKTRQQRESLEQAREKASNYEAPKPRQRPKVDLPAEQPYRARSSIEVRESYQSPATRAPRSAKAVMMSSPRHEVDSFFDHAHDDAEGDGGGYHDWPQQPVNDQAMMDVLKAAAGGAQFATGKHSARVSRGGQFESEQDFFAPSDEWSFPQSPRAATKTNKSTAITSQIEPSSRRSKSEVRSPKGKKAAAPATATSEVEGLDAQINEQERKRAEMAALRRQLGM